MSIKELRELLATQPVCPSCGLGCGTRCCKPRIPDLCCDECPELNRLPQSDQDANELTEPEEP